MMALGFWQSWDSVEGTKYGTTDVQLTEWFIHVFGVERDERERENRCERAGRKEIKIEGWE